MPSNHTDDDKVIDLAIKPKSKTQKPPMYKIILLNDDYTPMEFVIHILEHFFSINTINAHELMMDVHKKGSAVVAVFNYDIAETKVNQVMKAARKGQHPLQCIMEKE